MGFELRGVGAAPPDGEREVEHGRYIFRLSAHNAPLVREALAMSGVLNEALVDLDHFLAGEAPDGQGVAVCKLMVNMGQLITARECRLMAAGLRTTIGATRGSLELSEAEDELMDRLEDFAAFCAVCGESGGFTVY
jgi:hypothetical protein